MAAPKGRGKQGTRNPKTPVPREKAPRGRKPGSVNRTTRDVREAVALICQQNVDNLAKWIDVIGEEDPVRAADLLVRLFEYHIPRLARTEVTGNLTLTHEQALDQLE